MILLVASALADCPTSNGDVEATLAEAEVAFESMQAEPFEVAARAATDAVSCLGETVQPAVAARFFRVLGLRGFLSRDREDTVAAFRAQQRIAPELGLPGDIVEGHPLMGLFAVAAETPERPEVAMLPRPGVVLWVDGVQSTTRPPDVPSVIQAVDAQSGAVIRSTVVQAGAPYVTPEPLAPPPEAPRPPRKAGRGVSLALGTAAGVSAVGAGVLFGLGRASLARYDDPSTPYDQLDGLRKQTNSQHLAAEIAGVTAVGLLGALTVKAVF
ncbi:MAG: hypothetical protein H6734_13585 [Alphaproteobacteria bacterium]|nr:hypothetical protein [Alphaproteobacteria bacterium]